MIRNFREELLQGLWDRLARHARSLPSQRVFIIYELTHVLTCAEEEL